MGGVTSININRISSTGLILFVLLICAAGCPVSAENVSDQSTNINVTNQTRLLIDGEGQVLVNGEQRTFYQGYSIIIKGVGSRGDKAWIELMQNGTTVDYGVFGADDHFVYGKKDEIFNVTIDHIYVGSQKDLVFFYVYQYLDPDLPAPAPGSPFNTTPASNATAGTAGVGASNTTSATHANASGSGSCPGSVPGYGIHLAIGVLASAYLVRQRTRK